MSIANIRFPSRVPVKLWSCISSYQKDLTWRRCCWWWCGAVRTLLESMNSRVMHSILISPQLANLTPLGFQSLGSSFWRVGRKEVRNTPQADPRLQTSDRACTWAFMTRGIKSPGAIRVSHSCWFNSCHSRVHTNLPTSSIGVQALIS